MCIFRIEFCSFPVVFYKSASRKISSIYVYIYLCIDACIVSYVHLFISSQIVMVLLSPPLCAKKWIYAYMHAEIMVLIKVYLIYLEKRKRGWYSAFGILVTSIRTFAASIRTYPYRYMLVTNRININHIITAIFTAGAALGWKSVSINLARMNHTIGSSWIYKNLRKHAEINVR